MDVAAALLASLEASALATRIRDSLYLFPLIESTHVNVLIFDRTAARSVQQWDTDRSAPLAGRTVAAFSLAIWIGVIFLGRWIGFTTTRTDLKAEPDINIEGFLPPGLDDAGAVRTPR